MMIYSKIFILTTVCFNSIALFETNATETGELK